MVLVDGPRGPRQQVQQGVAWLAGYSQRAIVPFNIEASRCGRLRSWDQFQVPLPFSRVRIDIGEPILVPSDPTEQILEERRTVLEAVLRSLQKTGETWAAEVGGSDGPVRAG